MWQYNHTDELYHFGIKGMKWGVRRYQNKNGTLTSAGKKRYADQESDVKKSTAPKKDLSKRGEEFVRDEMKTLLGSVVTTSMIGFGSSYGKLHFATGTATNVAKATGNEKMYKNVKKGSNFIQGVASSWAIGTLLNQMTGSKVVGGGTFAYGTARAIANLRKSVD